MNFWAGFEKAAKPRWLKELGADPLRFMRGLAPLKSGTVSSGGVLRAKGTGRKELAKTLGLSKRTPSVHDLSISDPARRRFYERVDGVVHRIESPLSESGNNLRLEVTKDYLHSVNPSEKKLLSRGILPYQKINARGDVDLYHGTRDAGGLVERPVTTPSALPIGLPRNTIFAYNKDLFSSRPSSRQRAGYTSMVHSRVPERKVTYAPDTSGLGEVEAIIPGDVFKKGIKSVKTAASVRPEGLSRERTEVPGYLFLRRFLDFEPLEPAA